MKTQDPVQEFIRTQVQICFARSESFPSRSAFDSEIGRLTAARDDLIPELRTKDAERLRAIGMVLSSHAQRASAKALELLATA